MGFLIELAANFFDSFMGAYFVLKINKGDVKASNGFWTTTLLSFIVATAYLFISDFSIMLSIITVIILYIYAFSIKTNITFAKVTSPIIFELVLAFAGIIVAAIFGGVFNLTIPEVGSAWLGTLFSGDGFDTTSFFDVSLVRCLFLLSAKLIIFAVLFIILRFFQPSQKPKTFDFVLYLLSPVITIFVISTLITISFNYDTSPFYAYILISALGLILTNILSFVTFSRYINSEYAKNEIQILLGLRDSEIQRYNDSRKIYESVRILRHDIKEQLAYAKNMVEQGQSQSASDHISKLEDIVKETEIVQTGNRIIDSILYSKITLNPEIRFIVTGVLGDLDQIGDMELVSFFTNMLDNAIEAVKQTEEKIIELRFDIIGGFQNISCKNPFVPENLDNTSFKTTKKDKSLHGYGIKSMKKAIEISNGMIEFYQDGNRFVCHAALPVNDK